MKNRQYTIGIDATNLRYGGAVTHILEILRVMQPEKYGITKIYIWSHAVVLDALVDRPWLVKIAYADINKFSKIKLLWHRIKIPFVAKKSGCELLFVPGGGFIFKALPVVTMSRNLLPFERREFLRYGWSFLTLKNIILRRLQISSFRRCDGLIFLTAYAKAVVTGVIGKISGKITTIPHGLNGRFLCHPKQQLDVQKNNSRRPYKLIYVSVIDNYKHQWHVIEALSKLRLEGFNLHLVLIGSITDTAFKKFTHAVTQFDPNNSWINYCGKVLYAQLHEYYKDADMGVFASSCENMPNILLETMASGLPVVCSNMGPMREVLGDAGLYFDPESPEEIANAIRTFLLSAELRSIKSKQSFAKAKTFNWEVCADETCKFLISILNNT